MANGDSGPPSSGAVLSKKRSDTAIRKTYQVRSVAINGYEPRHLNASSVEI